MEVMKKKQMLNTYLLNKLTMRIVLHGTEDNGAVSFQTVRRVSLLTP